jgi:hypothetical protein
MNGKFKILGTLLLMLGTLLLPKTSFAGWGAIACNQNNTSCGVSYGWANLGSAKSYALVECLKSNRSCHIWQWEHNMCIHGPYGSYTCN